MDQKDHQMTDCLCTDDAIEVVALMIERWQRWQLLFLWGLSCQCEYTSCQWMNFGSLIECLGLIVLCHEWMERDSDRRPSGTDDQCVIDKAHTIVLHNSPSITPFEGGLSCPSGSSPLSRRRRLQTVQRMIDDHYLSSVLAELPPCYHKHFFSGLPVQKGISNISGTHLQSIHSGQDETEAHGFHRYNPGIDVFLGRVGSMTACH